MSEYLKIVVICQICRTDVAIYVNPVKYIILQRRIKYNLELSK